MINSLKSDSFFSLRSDLFTRIFEKYKYPWEILPHIRMIAEQLIMCGMDGYTLISDGVFIGKDTRIDKSAHIEGPCIIGHGCEVRHGAYIRGSVIIGDRCVIGNSSEIKNSIMMDGSQAPHFNYVGDSVLGEKSHLGAGAICSNLRSDGRNVVITGDGISLDSGLRKFGAILGDNTEIGCGAVLCPGTLIGKSTAVYPLTLTRGVYPEYSIIKNDGSVAKKVASE